MLNFKFFPVNGKVPLIPNADWREIATNDPKILDSWRKRYGSKITGWGLPTGIGTGVVVVDVDSYKSDFNPEGLILPETCYQDTPRGGRHYFYTCDAPIKSFVPRRGVEVKGEGGYVVIYNLPSSEIKPPPTWVAQRSGGVNHLQKRITTEIKISDSEAESQLSDLLETMQCASEGERNITLNDCAFRLGGLLRHSKLDKRAALKRLYETAISTGLGEGESLRTIESGFSKGSEVSLTNGSLPPDISASKVTLPPPPPKLEVPSLTMDSVMDFSKLKRPQMFEDWSSFDIILTSADGGTGKTTLTLWEAICYALGTDFLGFRPIQEPGKTLYIVGEDHQSKYPAMLGKLCYENGISGDDAKMKQILQSIYIYVDYEMCLVSKTPSGMIVLNQSLLDNLSKFIESNGITSVVFDPINAFWAFEFMPNDMGRAVMKFCRKLIERHNSIGINLINHLSKTSSKTNDMSQFSGRGGTTIPSQSRINRVIRRIVEKKEYTDLTMRSMSEGSDYLLCKVTKFSDHSKLLNRPFIIERRGWSFSKIDLQLDVTGQPKKTRKSISDRIHEFIFNRACKNYMTGANLILEEFKKYKTSEINACIDELIHLRLIKTIVNPNNPYEVNYTKGDHYE